MLVLSRKLRGGGVAMRYSEGRHRKRGCMRRRRTFWRVLRRRDIIEMCFLGHKKRINSMLCFLRYFHPSYISSAECFYKFLDASLKYMYVLWYLAIQHHQRHANSQMPEVHNSNTASLSSTPKVYLQIPLSSISRTDRHQEARWRSSFDCQELGCGLQTTRPNREAPCLGSVNIALENCFGSSYLAFDYSSSLEP
jgi:hypothetical protein